MCHLEEEICSELKSNSSKKFIFACTSNGSVSSRVSTSSRTNFSFLHLEGTTDAVVESEVSEYPL